MSKPTPGPWVIDWDTFPDGYVWVETPTGKGVALVAEARRADLNLIAAAPDLLEALIEIAQMTPKLVMNNNALMSAPTDEKYNYNTVFTAIAAIKKATGE